MNGVTQKNGKTKQTDYVLTPMLDELVRNVEFLGENVWFPSGAITILGGRKRCGKSTLALYECARFSAMGKKVLIVQREDDAGLVKAKLQCMGADLGNIMLYKRRAGGIEYCGLDAGDLRGNRGIGRKDARGSRVYRPIAWSRRRPYERPAVRRLSDRARRHGRMDACCRPFEWQSYADERAVPSGGEQEPQVDSREAQKDFLAGRLGAGQGG